MASGGHRTKANPEQTFHIAVAQYLALALPSHAAWTTFPAGGGGRVRGAMLKAMGLRAGWPDIQILVRSSPYDTMRSCSRFIGLELKRPKGGVVSAAQMSAHTNIRNAGGDVYVVRSLDEIYQVLTGKEGLALKAKPFQTSFGRVTKNAAA